MSRKSPKSSTLHTAFPAATNLDESPERMRWGWRIVLTLLLLFFLALLGLASARSQVQAKPLEGPQAQSTGEALVLAFYYSWFDEATWSSGTLSDQPVAPYVSRDRGAMARHMDQAKSAGIDALVVAWYGPHGEFNQTEANLTALLDEAAARSIKIAILFETDSPFFGGLGDATNALAHARDVHFAHPAYLRTDGRPVLFFWRPQMYGIDQWQSVRDQVDPGRNSIWVSEGVDVSYLRVFDGHHLYSNTWNPPADLNAVNRKFAGQVADAARAFGAGKLWVATVMPGYNDVRIRPGSGFAKDREDGAYYARSWQAAINSSPNWIVITSFNEWPEGTHIEPSVAHGETYLHLTRQWSDRFKAGGGQGVVAAAAPEVPPVHSASAAVAEAVPGTVDPVGPAIPTAIVNTALLNIRAGADLTHEIVGLEAAGTAFPIIGRSTDNAWWQIDYRGVPAWVFADLVRVDGPPDMLEAVPIADALQPQTNIILPTLHSPILDPARSSLRPIFSPQP